MGGELKMPGGSGRGPRRMLFSSWVSWACCWRMLCFSVDIWWRMATARRGSALGDTDSGRGGGGAVEAEVGATNKMVTHPCRLLGLQPGCLTCTSLLRMAGTSGGAGRAG